MNMAQGFHQSQRTVREIARATTVSDWAGAALLFTLLIFGLSALYGCSPNPSGLATRDQEWQPMGLYHPDPDSFSDMNKGQ